MLENVKQSVIDALCTAGLPAVGSYPERRLDRNSSAVCVSVASAAIQSSGCGNYLGICSEGGVITELYGVRADIVFNADIYAPVRPGMGADECARLLGELREALGTMPSGIKLRGMKSGDADFDTKTEMFRCRCELSCRAYLVRDAHDEPGGSFADFYLRGEMDGHEL